MTTEEKEILKKAIQSRKGLISPADMINSFAQHDRGMVENLVARGYLEMVSEVIATGKPINFYRVTELGLVQFEPFYTKLWFWFRGDIRTITVSAVTAIVVALITILLGIKQ